MYESKAIEPLGPQLVQRLRITFVSKNTYAAVKRNEKSKGNDENVFSSTEFTDGSIHCFDLLIPLD